MRARRRAPAFSSCYPSRPSHQTRNLPYRFVSVRLLSRSCLPLTSNTGICLAERVEVPLNPPRDSSPTDGIKRFASETLYLAGKSLSSSVRSSSLSLHPLAPASSMTWAGSEARGIGKTFALEVSQFRATWEGVFERLLANSSSLLSPEGSLP